MPTEVPMRPLLFALLLGCGADVPSLTISWTVSNAAGPVDCPAGSVVEVSVPAGFPTIPCTDGMGVLEPLQDSQLRAELALLGAGGEPLATASRLAVIDGPSEAAVVFVVAD